MNKFEEALTYVLKNEGGFIDHPLDPGGPTNMGITLATLSKWRQMPVNADDVKALKPNDVKPIYKAKYWDRMWLDQVISTGIATCVFDCSVLYGLRVATTIAQRTANFCLDEENVVDGIMGPATIGALNRCDETDFINVLHGLICHRIDEVIQLNPTTQAFRKGWEARADKLLTLIRASSH